MSTSRFLQSTQHRWLRGTIVAVTVLGAVAWWFALPTHHRSANADDTPSAVRGQLSAAADLSQAFSFVAEKLKPAVVSISAITKIRPKLDRRRQADPNLPPGLPDEFRRFFGDDFGGRFSFPDMPQEREGLGSGVIVSPDGYILTNNHVVRNATDVTVVLADDREFKAKIIGGDTKTDLAVLKIDANGLPAARLGNSDQMRVGQWVLAIGCPFGFDQTVTAGIISAKGRVVGIIREGYEDFLQTDAAINPGNSGGPLVNLQGEVIGINTAIESSSGGNVGIGFAIPTAIARNIMDSLIRDGKVVRGFLGAGIQPLTEDLAAALKFPEKRGVVIGNVMAGSPAEKSGLKDGDVVTQLNGKPVETVSQLRNGIAALPPNTKVELVLFREGKSLKVQVTIGQLGEDVAGATSNESPETEASELGLSVQTLTRDIAEQVSHTGELAGVVVTDVAPGSLAEKAGLQAGDVILKVGMTSIRNVDDYRKAIGAETGERKILLSVARRGVRQFVVIGQAVSAPR